jgi:hypothetical protein
VKPDERRWFVCVCYFVASFFAMLGSAFLIIFALDPFDRGAAWALLPAGVIDESPRTANVSRGRDARFNAAIFGNSHIQLVNPGQLSNLSGLKFVQLSIPGTGPREQAALLSWFIDHHSEIGALVIGVDDLWCQQEPGLPLTNPFPFWLYGDDAHYFLNVLGSRSFIFVWRRIHLASGLAAPTDPAGYWNYETGRIWAFNPAVENRPHVDLSPAPSVNTLQFPGLDHIEAVLARLGRGTRVIFVMPPQHLVALPQANSAAASLLTACKYSLQQRAAERRRAFLDFLLDTPLARDPENFWDSDHMRMEVAQMIELRIGEELRRLQQMRIESSAF